MTVTECHNKKYRKSVVRACVSIVSGCLITMTEAFLLFAYLWQQVYQVSLFSSQKKQKQIKSLIIILPGSLGQYVMMYYMNI